MFRHHPITSFILHIVKSGVTRNFPIFPSHTKFMDVVYFWVCCFFIKSNDGGPLPEVLFKGFPGSR